MKERLSSMNRFQIVALITVAATLFLIFVGGLVRASGAGLGCPDWPKCFGVWIPPMTVEELPAGWDPSQFNPVHTWTEYINRLIGVAIGLLITATLLLSLRYRKTDPIIPIASFTAFVLVLFQAWLGGQVVRSGLAGGMITLHMLLAMVIVNVLLFATWRGWKERVQVFLEDRDRRRMVWIMVTLLSATLIQMVLGTQVREMIDAVKNGPVKISRENWLDAESTLFLVHRSFSWLIVIIMGVFIWVQKQLSIPEGLKKTGFAIVALINLQILIGIGLERLAMPGTLQVLHLTGVSILICLQFAYLLVVGTKPQP